ncbi:TadE/TadG family type IV pilus assembly protein [Massilia sp. GCM10023247]|uniref:TadE/TadG family type IV pilus assembly protein n=1 Tax=Massilia sp. GCM10023247 TaxID=3252643 RepID=UPI00361BE847
MLATNLSRRSTWRPLRTQAGTAAIEFALLAFMFFMLTFGIIELARLLFVFNTLHEVTRRAAAEAAQVYPRDTDATARVRQFAIFRSSPGGLVLANPVTDEHIRLDYLRSDLSVIPEGSWPADAAANRRICMSDPRAPTCIRFVQASICNPAVTGQCDKVTVQMLLSLIDMRVPLHRATTIVPVESLGYVPGTMPPAG